MALPAEASPPAELPAFERRARLRNERHRLVSEVRRRDGTSHQEINAWLNRKLGITSRRDLARFTRKPQPVA